MRKAFLVSKKLHLKDFEDWIKKEQEGFSGDIPDYRVVKFEIKAWNPYHGWIPVILPAEYAEELTRFPVGLPISTLSNLYQNDDTRFALSVPEELSDMLNKNSKVGFYTKYSYQASKVELHRIISAVRTKILEWAILLEQTGIKGEELSFSDTEIDRARESKTINNFTNNFYSAADNTRINQG